MKFKSQLVTQVSGSVGGLTGAHGPGGMFLRARAMPSDPASRSQVSRRNLVRELSAAWVEELTEAQRQSWEIYAANVTVTDVLGEQRNLSGQQHYVRSNSLLWYSGQQRVDTAPTEFGGTSFTAALTGNFISSGIIQFSFDEAAEWNHVETAGLLIFASRPQNPGLSYFGGSYRFQEAWGIIGSTPTISPGIFGYEWEAPQGTRVFARFMAVIPDGRIGGPVTSSVVMT